MLMTGKEYLESIRDGRALYVGRERIADQTKHPAFAGGARTYAALYDLKSDPALRDVMTFSDGDERYSMYYLQPRSQEDLRRRTRAHRKIAEFCFGLMGRTPDAIAGNITGLSMKPEVFDAEPGGNRGNLLNIYQHMRRDDIFATYALVPPPAARNKDYYQAHGLQQPALRVTAEDDNGVTINGMKMLASGAAYAHEVLIGNVMPLAPDQRKESITCVIPLNLPGLSLWSRRPFNRADTVEFDSPLTYHFDESDCMLVFQDVKVPWEKVIVHDNAGLSRNIYIQTPSHVMANHQCNVALRHQAAVHGGDREPLGAGDWRPRHSGGARYAWAFGRHGGRLQRHDRRANRGLAANRSWLCALQPPLSLRRDQLGDGEPLHGDRHHARTDGWRAVSVPGEHRGR